MYTQEELRAILLVVGVLLAPVILVFVVPHLLSAIVGLAARVGIWVMARLAGHEEIYGEDRADEGRMARHGRARTALAPRGRVFVSGELWDAEAETPVAAGERIEVLSRTGLLLRVRAAADDETPSKA
jgi:membrane-bound ClpP family serine protease